MRLKSWWFVQSQVSALLCGLAFAFAALAVQASPTGVAAPEAALDANEYRTCALREDATLMCWGDVNYGDYEPPTGRYIAVSVGFDHACALRPGGQAVCWGNSSSTATSPPAGSYAAIAAGNTETCAVRTDGQLRCWGGVLADTAPTTGRFVDVALYNGRACAIRSDGGLQCWQAAGVSSLGVLPSGRFMDVALGQSHACALRSDGQALCWGSNAQGQTAVPAATAFVALGVGYQHTCGVRENGSLVCWGANPSGQLTVPAGGYTALAVGRGHACARDEEGAIRCWGDEGPGKGALSVPSTGFDRVFAGPGFACGLTFGNESLGNDIGCVGATTAMTPPVRQYRDLSFGSTSACGVALDGQIECWGQSLGALPQNERVQSVAVGEAHACALRTSDGTAVCWGENGDGQATPPADVFSTIVSGDRFSCGINSSTGRVICWGQGAAVTSVPPNQYFYDIHAYGANICGFAGGSSKFCWGADAAALQPPATILNNLVVGARHACAIQLGTGGRIACWGDNSQGQLQVPTDNGYYKLDAYGDMTCAYNNDGLRCWGAQTLARGNPGFRMAPVGIAAGDAHTCTVRGNRGVGCWGDNAFGQRNAAIHRAQSISANADHTCSLQVGGEARCWGDNTHNGSTPPSVSLRMLDMGQFNGCGVGANGAANCWGWNVNAQSTPPVALFRSVATGLNHSCGVRDDGTLACWGYNADGQTTAPTGVFKAVDVGERHSCAIAEAGSVTCWGLNSEGQTTPPELGAATYRSLASGAFHNCAILSNGGIACWGRNANGQATPPEEGQYVSIAAGTAHTCAVRDDGGRVCWGANESGQAPQPTLSPVNLPTIRNGEPLAIDFRLDSHGGYVPFGATYQIVSGKLPYGSFLNAFGQARGTPADNPGDYTLTIEAKDENGFVASRSYAYTLIRPLDVSSPAISALVNGEEFQAEWYNSNVQLQWQVSDNETPFTVETGCLPAAITQDADLASFVCSATSEGGTTSRTILLGRDTVAPDTRFVRTPPPVYYTNLPYNDITFEFAQQGSDRSGVESYQCSFYGTEGSYGGCGSVFTQSYPIQETPFQLWVRAVDRAGNVDPTPATYTWYVRRDTTPPTVVPILTGTVGDNGWYRSDVGLTWSINEPETTVTQTSGCADRSVVADTTGVSFMCSAFSSAGEGVGFTTIRRDTVAPTVLASLSAAPNAAGWYRQNVTASYTCTDVTSGLAALCPASETVSQEGAGIQVSAKTVRDMAGNATTVAGFSINLDKTAPLVVTELRTPANAFGWHRSDVTIDFTCTETLSGLAGPCPSPYTFTQEGRDLTYVVPVGDIAGNQTIGGRTLSIDRTAPTISASATTPPNAAGWYRTNVGVAFACNDALSGINVCPFAQTLSQEGEAVSSTPQTAVDYASNVSAPSNVVTVKIDKTAPTLNVTMPPATVLLNATHDFQLSASDALSGVATQSCSGFVTGSLGTRSVTCTATDRAGNSVSRSSTYRVVYGYAALSAPLIDPSQVYVVQAPRSVPLEWRLFDANGAAITNATLTQSTVTDIACPSTGVGLTTAPSGETNSFAHLGDGMYRRNWWINYTGTGCLRLDITLNDGTQRSAMIRVVPKVMRTGGNYPSTRPPVRSSNAAPAQVQPTRTPATRPNAPRNPRRPDLKGQRKH